jgi:hypothetical protein
MPGTLLDQAVTVREVGWQHARKFIFELHMNIMALGFKAATVREYKDECYELESSGFRM